MFVRPVDKDLRRVFGRRVRRGRELLADVGVKHGVGGAGCNSGGSPSNTAHSHPGHVIIMSL
ncbi:MAG: hypothetical protein ACI9MC_001933 [Kiritimatiellia bacterium]|jgi:hypothetical protein